MRRLQIREPDGVRNRLSNTGPRADRLSKIANSQSTILRSPRWATSSPYVTSTTSIDIRPRWQESPGFQESPTRAPPRENPHDFSRAPRPARRKRECFSTQIEIPVAQFGWGSWKIQTRTTPASGKTSLMHCPQPPPLQHVNGLPDARGLSGSRAGRHQSKNSLTSPPWPRSDSITCRQPPPRFEMHRRLLDPRNLPSWCIAWRTLRDNLAPSSYCCL